ncbi:MAG TPA: HisA/HisF-related TIM barrel protein [Gemmatimonadaceae bacterium]|nr:HisA/HisF-related TIM barrel protein [Gemmatimonadaceae bacterium]
MLAIPVVDLRGGATIQPGSPRDPISAVRSLATLGFRRVHLIDQDALGGSTTNLPVIDDVIRDGSIEVQVEGCIESTDQIEQFLDSGASQVVLGSRALEEPEWLAGVAAQFPGSTIVATNVRDRRVGLRGWPRRAPVDVLDLVEELSGLPLGGLLIVPLRAADGALENSELALLEDIAEASDAPLLASGGVPTMNDLRALEHRGIAAVLLGSAIFTDGLDARAVAQEFAD